MQLLLCWVEELWIRLQTYSQNPFQYTIVDKRYMVACIPECLAIAKLCISSINSMRNSSSAPTTIFPFSPQSIVLPGEVRMSMDQFKCWCVGKLGLHTNFVGCVRTTLVEDKILWSTIASSSELLIGHQQTHFPCRPCKLVRNQIWETLPTMCYKGVETLSSMRNFKLCWSVQMMKWQSMR